MMMAAWSKTNSTIFSVLFKKAKIVAGFDGPGYLLVVGNGSRGYMPLFVTLNLQGSWYRPQPGPKGESCVHAGPVRAPGPKARETTRSWRGKCADV